jgi:hypothetical protein
MRWEVAVERAKLVPADVCSEVRSEPYESRLTKLDRQKLGYESGARRRRAVQE